LADPLGQLAGRHRPHPARRLGLVGERLRAGDELVDAGERPEGRHVLPRGDSPLDRVRPSTLTVSRVEAGTSTALGSVAWANDSTRDYDLTFESWCEFLGAPVYLFAAIIDRSISPPRMSDSNHDLAYGPAGVTALALTDAASGLSNGLIGVPALVALPGTAGATFSRVRLYNPAPCRAFSGFGPRPIGVDWSVATVGSILADTGGMVLPL
jgi:hypothetical protein